MAGIARIGLGQEPDTLFPGMQAMASAGDVLAPLTTRPLHYDDRGRAHPRVLRRIPVPGRDWVMLPNGGMRITYHWRRGYRWHDGTPLSAADAVWTWRLRMDSRVQVDSRWYDPQIQDMQAPKPLVLVVTWSRKLATANHYYLMLPRHILEPEYLADPEGFHLSRFGRSPVSTGPYRFRHWEPGHRIELDSVPGFREGTARLDRLEFRFLPDPEAMMSGLLQGDIDVLGTNTLDPERGEQLASEGRGRITVHFVPSYATERVDFNLDHPHLGRPEVRRALALSVDRARVVARATGGRGQPAGSWLPERHFAHQPLPFGGPDIYRGQRLLAAAGYRPRAGAWVDDDGRALEFELLTLEGDPVRERLASDLAEAWRQVGARVTVRTGPPRVVFGERARHRQFDALLYAWLMHPDTIGRGAWHSSQVPSERNGWSGHNFSGWRDKQVDRLLERAEVEFNRDYRRDLLGEHQRLFARDLPALPLYQRIEISAHHRDLVGITPGGSSVTPVTWNAHRWRWRTWTRRGGCGD